MTAGGGDVADVVIVGAGAVGLALAFELARRDVETVVVERAGPGDRTSSSLGAAAGLVNPQAHPGVEPEAVRELSLFSRRRYADWVDALEGESGLSCDYDVRGGLTVARSEAEEVLLDRALDWQRQRGLPFEVLSAEEARGREPSLGAGVRAAFAFPEDGQIAPPKLARALALAARNAGARLLSWTPATAVIVEGGRVSGVRAGATSIHAGVVVNAAGAWAAHLAGVPPAPIAPVKAQLVALDASGDPDRLRRFAFAPGLLLVPRRDGTLVIGSPLEHAGFDARPTAAAVASLLAGAAALVPALAAYPVLDLWAGLHPSSPDGVPILGETAVPGYWLAAGHGRNGTLLAPGSAALLADLLTAQRSAISPTPFSPARFAI